MRDDLLPLIQITFLRKAEQTQICTSCTLMPDCQPSSSACGLVKAERRKRARYFSARRMNLSPRERRRAQRIDQRAYLTKKREKMLMEILEQAGDVEAKLARGEWKRCNTCQTPWPCTLEFFHANPQKANGMHGSCKICRCAAARVNAEKRRRAQGVRTWTEVWPQSKRRPGSRIKQELPKVRENFFGKMLRQREGKDEES